MKRFVAVAFLQSLAKYVAFKSRKTVKMVSKVSHKQ